MQKYCCCEAFVPVTVKYVEEHADVHVSLASANCMLDGHIPTHIELLMKSPVAHEVEQMKSEELAIVV